MATSEPTTQVQVHPETKHPAYSSSWKKGGPSPNPGGKTTPERKAMRAVSETFRELHSPAELAEALWAISSGLDPFARARKRNPDGVPEFGAAPIDWTHRMAALRLYAEYALGKPLQGVVVDAQVQQQIAISGRIETGPIDVRAMPPEVRAALRLAASAALGRPLLGQCLETKGDRVVGGHVAELPLLPGRDKIPNVQMVKPVLDVVEGDVTGQSQEEVTGGGGGVPEIGDAGGGVLVHDLNMRVNELDVKRERKEILARQLDDRAHAQLSAASVQDRSAGTDLACQRTGVAASGQPEQVTRTLSTSERAGEYLEGAGEAEAVDFVHALIMGADRPNVKRERKEIVLDFRDSANLVDATLDARGTLTVRFRAPGGGVARSYRYAHVTPEMMAAWRAAPSAGAWFSREIRVRHQQYPLIKDPIREPGVVL